VVLGLALAVAGCEPERPDPAPDATEPANPAEVCRAESIRAGLQALDEECRRVGGGDWDGWSRRLDGYRANLRGRIAAARPNHPDSNESLEARFPVLEAAGEPPLFEPHPASYLQYLLDPGSVEPFRQRRPVAAVSRWLRARGTDLLFVPVPKMTEAYPDRMAGPCPPDHIVAPHVRRLLRELLEQDVEVLDLLPAFLAAPDRDANPLYCLDDPHWSPRAKELAAAAIADRARRYLFARCARESPPLFRGLEAPWLGHGAAYGALTPGQRARVDKGRPRTYLGVDAPGGVAAFDQRSPVLFIGDSYNGGMAEHVARELNVPVAVHWGGGQTSEAVVEAARNPALFRGRKLIVWVVCNTSLGDAGGWILPPPVIAANEGDRP
jgi:hypothetical protein